MNRLLHAACCLFLFAPNLVHADLLPRLGPSNINDKPIPEDQREFLLGGCSWYCGAPRINVSASSVLTEPSGSTHPAEYAHDHKLSTAWVEGSSANGAGESLSFHFLTTKEDTTNLAVTSITILSGFQATKKLFIQNSRPKTIQLFYDDRAIALLELKDTMGSQTFTIPKLLLARPSKHKITLQILDVYPGRSFKDACITDVMFSGEGDMH